MTVPPFPSRDDPGTTPPRTCPICRQPFRPTGRQHYCSTRCRKTAWRRRHTADLPAAEQPPAGRSRRDSTVYACPDCDLRLLGEQWCPDCTRPMRRVAAGGPCPHCGDPVALTDLLPPRSEPPLN